MAGLIDYLMLGLAVSGGYIGVKYGPQIISNLQSNQANPPAKTQQPADTSTTPTDETGQPTSPTGVSQHNTGTYPHSSQNQARHITQHPAPSGGPQGTAPIVRKRSPQRPLKPNLDDPGIGIKASAIDAQQNCACKNGVWVQSKPGQPVCDLVGLPCSGYGDYDYDFYEANIGYANSYNTPVPGPQWYKSMPYNEVIASVGMSHPQGRVRRALAANNHNFCPGGFVLSEASVRRGVNNVYSAGT